MGNFVRNLLPEPASFYEAEGLKLIGRGKWRTARCDFHDGSDSLRINTESGAWVCMACGAKGGDVVAYAMRRNGWDFLSAARALGAYVEDDKPYPWGDRPRRVSARDAIDVIVMELYVPLLIVSDLKRGLIPNDGDWHRFLDAVARINFIVEEYRK